MKRFLNAFVLSSLCVATLSAASLPVRTIVPREPAPEQVRGASHDGSKLMLQAGIFDPTLEKLDFASVGLGRTRLVRSASKSVAAVPEYAIIQFQPGQQRARAELELLGVEFLGYLPDNAFQVRLDPSTRRRIAGQSFVRWIGDFEPGYKISPILWPGTEVMAGEVTLHVFPAVSLDDVYNQLAAKFPQIVRTLTRQDPFTPRERISIPYQIQDAFIQEAAQIEGVRWIEAYEEPQLHNINSSGPIQGNLPAEAGRTIFAHHITGTGQIAAVADLGLDSDMCFFRNLNGVQAVTLATDTPSPAIGPLFPRQKVIGYWVQPGANAYDTDASCDTTPGGFHGTHTTGTVAGDNQLNPSSPDNPGINEGDGMAPNAQILFQDIGATSGCLNGLQDPRALYEQALAGGARIHSNSYGGSTAGTYSSDDQDTDRFLFDHEEMAIFFSAGNAGPGATTIGSPGVAKNVVTVGALGNGNNTNPARFSSRGPTADGRLKPDIVAPGSSIVSAAGDTIQGDNNCGTSSKSGTSMACPTVAGGAVLLRQYFADGFYPTGSKDPADAINPSASMVKAVLLNGTLALPVGGLFGDLAVGWGRIFLDNNLFFPNDTRKLRMWGVSNGQGLKTSESNNYSVAVRAGQEFRATLVWSDPEGTLGAASALVNNLDLTVITPAGTFVGNSLTPTGESQVGANSDRTNNVEQVRFTAPVDGIYSIRVTGTSVPGNGRGLTDRQGYALAVSAAACSTAVTAPPASVVGSSNSRMGIDLAFVPASGSTSTQIYRANGTCSAPTGDFQYVGRTVGNFVTDPRAQGGVTYSYKVRGTDDCGEGPISSCVTVTSTGLCDLVPTFSGVSAAIADSPNCRITVQWAPAKSNCVLGQTIRYNIYRSKDPDFIPSGSPYATVTGNTFSDINVVGGVTYYYIVRAEDSVTAAAGPNGGNEEKNALRAFATAFGAPGATGTFTDDAGDTNAYLSAEAPWQITSKEAHDGPRSYHSAADNAVYPGDTCAAVTTPSLTLDANAQLSYWARYNFEFQWDGVIVEASSDGGNSWNDLPPSVGYPSTLTQTMTPPINACKYPVSHGAFTGPDKNQTKTEWTFYTSSLAAYAGKAVRIRWRMTTDPGAAYDGFFLDTISITSVMVPTSCIQIAVKPAASFLFSPRAPVVGTPVAFTDTSSNSPVAWLWSFGDGSTSTEKNPTHTYTTPGVKTVTLTVTNAAGTSAVSREITVGSVAANYTAQLILPGQARAQGAAGSFFRTSMWLTNPGNSEIVVRLRYVPTGAFGGAEETAFVTIPANRSIAFQDVLGDALGAVANTSGSIVVEVADGNTTPLVTSRTFNDAGAKGTFGQYIQAIPLTGSQAGETFLEGLGGDVANRSNVGVLNLSNGSIDATITIRDADGVVRGNSIPVTVPSHGVVQINGVNIVAGAGSLAVFSTRITANGSFFAYASKLDNKTSDPIFIPSSLTPKAAQWIDGVGSLVGANNTLFKSNLSLTNRNSVPATVNIALTPRGGTAPTASVSVTVPPATTKFYNDAVAELFGFQGAASLSLTTSASTPVVAWARTYSDKGADGTLGQFIPGFGTADLIGIKGAVLQGLSQNSGYRTNAGIVNTSAAPVAVTVSVWRADGTKAGEKVYTPLGGQSLFISQIIRDITGNDTTDGYLRVLPSAPGAIYAWASFVDNVSTDQTFVRPIAIP